MKKVRANSERNSPVLGNFADNVFYELGYAHALGKPAVLLIRRESGRDIPFDIRGYRAIVYDDSISGKKIVERNLAQHLRAVKRDPLIA
jgi:hypothetical protein